MKSGAAATRSQAKLNSKNPASYKPLNKQAQVSDMLENETKKMEERLELVKQMMELEKDKRSQKAVNHKEGTLWRGATQKKGLKNYSETVMAHHQKAKQFQSTPKNAEGKTAQNTVAQNQAAAQQFRLQKNPSKTSTASQAASAKSGTAGQAIQNNLNNALKMQNNEQYAEVAEFLQSIKLEKYFDKLIDNGIEDQETILELQDQHIEQIGIPLGHKLKIIKRIKDIRAEKGMSVPQSRQGTRREDISYQDGVSSRPVTKNNYAELPGPTSMSTNTTNTVGQGQITSSIKSHAYGSQSTTDGSLVGISSLKEGAYDEDESHKGFLEALNAWRKAGQKDGGNEPSSVKSDKKVKFQDVEKAWEHQKDNKKKGSFFANIQPGESNFNMSSIPTWQEGGTMPDKKLSSKESCWQCYKLYNLTVETSEFKQGEKGFCSKACFDKYNAANSNKCMRPGCGKSFLKTEGHFTHGKWFCSESCAQADPEIKQIEEMQAKLKASKLSGAVPEEDDDDEEEVEYEI